MVDIFEAVESNVRSYCRQYPAIFNHGEGSTIRDKHGDEYIDFFCGAGALNYGHNHPVIKKEIIKYIENDHIMHSLDMFTVAKERFLKKFRDIILEPRNMQYKVQFCNTSGANSVEAALKLSRKITGRNNVISFTNAFHGMTLGALSATGAKSKRSGAGISLHDTVFMPYDGYFGSNVNTIDFIDKMLSDPSSGIEAPAAFIVETIQAEGGINTASPEWLRGLRSISHKYGSLLIVDDIQVGCGRTGQFFSFENYSDLNPDLVCLSKSLSGYGLPFSILLIKPEYDVWKPGEHNGTFRGNNLAFISSAASLDFWADSNFIDLLEQNTCLLGEYLSNFLNTTPEVKVRGRGMIKGIIMPSGKVAHNVLSYCFKEKLIIETSGPHDEVIKIMPPLNIKKDDLYKGMNILSSAIKYCI